MFLANARADKTAPQATVHVVAAQLEMADETADAAAAVVSQAIEGFGAHLAAQAFTPPAMVLRTVEDIYFEGLRASRSKASAARVREAWEEAATKLPAQVAADVRRTLEALPGSTTISGLAWNNGFIKD